MKRKTVLMLGDKAVRLVPAVWGSGCSVVLTDEAVTADDVARIGADWIVCHGYRHILRKDVLDLLEGRAVNLHPSFLPWNRGADPNFWSFVDDTPRGVTVHFIDEGLDTGDIIRQQVLPLTYGGVDTLRSVYDRLQDLLCAEFCRAWPSILAGTCTRTRQPFAGSYHAKADLEPLRGLLRDGWDTPVLVLTDFAAERQASAAFWEGGGR